MAPTIQDPLLPPGSLVLVTGANGLIASHIVDQFLHYGYSVRGTVRSASRCAWVSTLLKQRYPSSSPSFELVEIPDITAPGAYDAALKGVSAVVQTASSTNLSDDPTVIQAAIDGNLNILEGVRKANVSGESSSIKRVVLTSSSWAAAFPQPNVPQHCDASSYDSIAASTLDSPGAKDLPAAYRGVLTYTLSKVRSEKAAWEWYALHASDAGFVLNTVLPSTVLGPILDPQAQPYPSTCGFIRNLYEAKDVGVFQLLPPHWFVDVRDTARLHVAAAVLKGVEGERIYSWADTFTWPQIKELLEKEMEKAIDVDVPDKGLEMATRDGQRPVELLGMLGEDGWVGLEASVKGTIRSFYSKA